MRPVRRGEIYWAVLDPVRGREQAGRRPVLVVSSDGVNRLPLVVTVVLGTSGENLVRDYATNVRVPAAESGLPKETVFLGYQVRSLDAIRFEPQGPLGAVPSGRLPPPRMRQVDDALRRMLGL